MKVRDLIKQLQKIEGDREVMVGFPALNDEDEDEGEFDVFPILPEITADTVENQLAVIIFADPPEELEDEDAENENPQ